MRFVPLLFLLLAACAEPPPTPLSATEAAERDSILALLGALDPDDLTRAFARLGAAPHVLETQVEQLGADGTLLASRTRTTQHTADGVTMVSTDSAGAFAFGAFGGEAVWRAALDEPPVAPRLPADAPWLDARGREAFRFGTAPDTLLGDRPVRVLTVEARPGEGDGQPLRSARLYLDPETEALVGFRLRRVMDAVLFGETTASSVLLHPGPDGWRPYRTHVETMLGAPLATPRRLRLTRRYAY
ncbi:MAG: hypothetical protein AAGI91_01970 [Bacteroidota bacterium]